MADIEYGVNVGPISVSLTEPFNVCASAGPVYVCYTPPPKTVPSVPSVPSVPIPSYNGPKYPVPSVQGMGLGNVPFR